MPQGAAHAVIDDLKRAIAEDDCHQLEALLKSEHLSRRPDRVDLIIDKAFDGLRGRSCLHRSVRVWVTEGGQSTSAVQRNYFLHVQCRVCSERLNV